MRNKRILIFGAGVFQLAGIQSARGMGLEVVTIDANPNAPGFSLADHYEIVSTTNTDATRKVATRYGVQGVMTMSTDTCVPTVAYVAEKLGLVGIGIQTALKATNKLYMRQSFEAAGVPSPHFKKVWTLNEAETALGEIGLPAMMKAPDSSGSRGAGKVEETDQLEPAFRRAIELSKGGFVLLEEFLEGVEVGGEAFCYNEELLMCFVTNKTITPPPYYVPCGHSLPSRLDEDTQLEIQKVVYDGSQALGIKSGPINFDVMLTEEGPKIIELGARLGGTCLPSIVRYHSGINTVEAAIRLAVGEDPSMLFQANRSIPVAVRLITTDKGGILTKARFPEDIDRRPEVLEYTLDVKEGSPVKPFTCGANRFGHVICRGHDWREAEASATKVIEDSILNAEIDKTGELP